MSFFLEESTPQLKAGTQDVQALYLGDHKVWPNTPIANGMLFSAERLAVLFDRINQKVEPQWTAWQPVVTSANQALTASINAPADGVWYVPGRYIDNDAHQAARLKLDKDANNAYTLALYSCMTGSVPHAEKAVAIIRAWTEGVTSTPGVSSADTGLSWCYHFPAMIFAASLLKTNPVFDAALQQAFASYLVDFALPLSVADKTNNWGSWGVAHDLSIGIYLEDQALITARTARWKEHIDEQITETGEMWAEVTRNTNGELALWYTNFALMPATISAELLRNHGVNVFEYVSPRGRTLRKAYDRAAPWMLQPAQNPFNPVQSSFSIYVAWFEIVATRWPNAYVSTKLQNSRPINSNHTASWLTFTHGEPLVVTTPPVYDWIEVAAGNRPVRALYQNAQVTFTEAPFSATEDRTVYTIFDRTAQVTGATTMARLTQSTDTAGVAIRAGNATTAAYTLKVGYTDGDVIELSEPVPSAVGRHILCSTISNAGASIAFQVDNKTAVTADQVMVGAGLPDAHLNLANQPAPSEMPIAGYYFRGAHSASTRAAVIQWLATEHNFTPSI